MVEEVQVFNHFSHNISMHPPRHMKALGPACGSIDFMVGQWRDSWISSGRCRDPFNRDLLWALPK